MTTLKWDSEQNYPNGFDHASRLGLLEISEHEFEDIRCLIYEQCGIHLTDSKRTLVAGRLQKVIRNLGFNSFGQYLSYLKADPSRRALGELINRISTNHTFFFREQTHFDFFVKRVLPETLEHLKKRNARDLRVWCAGCSTGEEAYGLTMLMLEFFGPEYNLWDAGLLATDISAPVLEDAKSGIYSEERISMVPPQILNKYFERRPGQGWAVIERVKKEVTFRRFNLMNQIFPFKKPFEVIFCRNVMIYFDQPTREALVKRFYDFTTPGGYLFIGHSESLRRDSCPYEYVLPAVYRRPGG